MKNYSVNLFKYIILSICLAPFYLQSAQHVVESWLERESIGKPDSYSSPQLFFEEVTKRIASTTSVGQTGAVNISGVIKSVLLNNVGSCGDFSNALISIASNFKFKARLVNLYNYPKVGWGHTLVEIYFDNDWHLFDPTYGVTYVDSFNKSISLKALLNSDFDDSFSVKYLCNCLRDQMGKLYTSKKAFLDASPKGAIGPTYPMAFTIPVLFEANNREVNFGVLDGSHSDLLALNAQPANPAGIFMLGAAYQNVSHKFKITGLDKLIKGNYQILVEYNFLSKPQFELCISIDSEFKDCKLLKNSKFSFLSPITNNGMEILVSHNERVVNFVQIDSVSVKLLEVF